MMGIKFQNPAALLLCSLFMSLFALCSCALGHTKIVDNGDVASHIDITFIGSGFTQGELSEYVAKVQGNVDKLFEVNWFADNRATFNIWRVDAVAAQSGRDLSDAEISSYAASTPADIVVVIHNYDCQESEAKSYIELCKRSHEYYVLAHELGHRIGRLADEYWTPATAYKCDGLSKRTLNIHDQPNSEKWSEFIATPPYEGGRYCEHGLWRPSENSIMRDSANTNYFDALGYKAMSLGADILLGIREGVPPGLKVYCMQQTTVKSGPLPIEAIVSDASGVERVEFYWARAGETSKSIKIDKEYPYNITIDTTRYPSGQYYLDTLAYDKNWNYSRVTSLFTIANPTVSLTIPITVREALTLDSDSYVATGIRRDMAGLDRTEEPLTVGIPLPEDSGITSIDQLGLYGSTLQQFRPLDYWDNGTIKWVLVDTQVTLPANGNGTLYLVGGNGNSGDIDLAMDGSEYIAVDTGVAAFRVRKSRFNLLDAVVVSGRELVKQGHPGGLSLTGSEESVYTLHGQKHTLCKGTVYSSFNDCDSTAEIEENGPARAVVKATGAFKDGSGNRFMDYTVRLHFYKGKSYVKAAVILRHSREEVHPNEYKGYDQKPRTFANVQLAVPLSLSGPLGFSFSTNKGMFSGQIAGTASVFQGFSQAHFSGPTECDTIDGTKGWSYPPMKRIDEAVKNTNYLHKGFELRNGQQVLHSAGNDFEWSTGCGSVSNANKAGLTVAMQYLSSYWPASMEFTDRGTAEIGIFSKYNTKKDICMSWGTHETRTLMFDFHTAAIDDRETVYRLEQPVVGRAPLECYSQPGVLYLDKGLVDADTFMQFWYPDASIAEYDIPKEPFKSTNTGLVVWRVFWYSGVQGTDYPLSGLISFLSGGAGGRYMGGLQKTVFNADSGVIRSDGFDFAASLIKFDYRYRIVDKGTYNAGGGQNHFDFEHNHWIGMPLYYYLTGNEDFKEAITDYLEEFAKRATPNLQASDVSLRALSRILRTYAIGYEFNRDPRLLDKLKELTEAFLDSREVEMDKAPYGRNMQRGYIHKYLLKGRTTSHSLFEYPIHPEDFWQALRVLKRYDSAYARIEDMEDYLLGLAQFAYHEPYLSNADGSETAYVYDYYMDSPNQWINGTDANGNYMRNDDTSRGMLHAFEQTGDAKYLERGKQILSLGAGTGSAYPLPAHDLLYTLTNGPDHCWSYVEGVTAVHKGGGQYALSWTVPSGAVEYKIKFSEKPIVDWLGFDQQTRTFQYDPSHFAPYFATYNVDNEPAPLAAGTRQEITLSIQDIIDDYNRVRGLDSSNPLFVSYRPEAAYHFSVKYLLCRPEVII